MLKTNSQKARKIRGIISSISDEDVALTGNTRFSKKEMSLIVESIIGKNIVDGGWKDLFRQNIPNWIPQSTADYIPTSKNLDVLINALRAEEKAEKAKVSDSIPSVVIDWNMVICEAMKSNNVSSILIENGSVIIDFK